jgi:hypothetical protein
MRHICPETRRITAWAALILAGIATWGCDQPPPLNPVVPSDDRILMLVGDVDDFSRDKSELERIIPLFVKGSEPSKEALQGYMAYRYEGKRPVQSGDSAIVVVVVKDAKTGDQVGEMQWSMTKVNDVWRIKNAPLPADAGHRPF